MKVNKRRETSSKYHNGAYHARLLRDHPDSVYSKHILKMAQLASDVAYDHGFERVVDLGAGEGCLVNEINETGFDGDVFGFELDPLAVGLAEELGHDVRQADITDPFILKECDSAVVTLCDVLEHIPHEKVVKLLEGLSAVDAHLQISIPPISHFDPWAFQQWEKDEFSEILKDAGFANVMVNTDSKFNHIYVAWT